MQRTYAVLGARLRRAREEEKLSVKELAEALDVQPPTVYKWEQGRHGIAMPMLERIARVLHRSPSWFLESIRPRGRLASVLETAESLPEEDQERIAEVVRVLIQQAQARRAG